MQDILPMLLDFAVEQVGLAWKRYDPMYKKQFRYKPMRGLIVNKAGIEKFGRPGPRNPGEGLKYDTLKRDFDKAYIRLGYSLATLIPKEIWDADQAGVFMKVIPSQSGALAQSHMTLREYLASEYIANIVFAAEGNNTPTTSDGRPLLSTAHPRSKSNTGSTWSNRLSTATSLSVAGYQAAASLLRRQKDATGFHLINDGPMRLLASMDYHYISHEILKSINTPYTAERTDNWMTKDNVELLLNAYWTAQSASGLAAGFYDSWMLQGENHGMHFYYAQEQPELENDYLLSTRSHLYVATTESVVGSDHPYSVVGSPGNG